MIYPRWINWGSLLSFGFFVLGGIFWWIGAILWCICFIFFFQWAFWYFFQRPKFQVIENAPITIGDFVFTPPTGWTVEITPSEQLPTVFASPIDGFRANIMFSL